MPLPRVPGVRSALGLAVPLVLALLPAASRAQAPVPTSHVARVTLDSAAIEVEIGAERGRVVAETPAGAFRLVTDPATLAAWAEAGAKLRAPRPGDGPGRTDFDAIVLRDAQNEVAMRLARVGPDSMPVMRFDAADAAFSHAMLLSPQQWQRLRGALAGEWRDTMPHACPTARACYEFETDEPAMPDPRNRAPEIPGFVDRHMDGEHLMVEFVVGVDGRPRPETILVRRSPMPAFARAVREAVLAWRFTPARKDGLAVPAVVLQRIDLRVR
jgi:hypothetical protein